MTEIRNDLKYAARALFRTPMLTTVAVMSLALGIGANTAIFTLLDQLILRLLPVKDPQQLVMIWSTGPHMGNNRGDRAASYPMYQDYQQKAQAFSHVFARFRTPLSISFEGSTERVDAELVSGNYFQALGVGAAAGRVFNPEEDDRTYKGHPAVVLNHTFWTERFAARRDIVGKKILVNNYPMTIVGVSAPGFSGIDPSEAPHIRIPIQMKPLMTPGWDAIGDRRSQWIQMFGRLKAGHTPESARASLDPLFRSILNYELTLESMRDLSAFNRGRFLKRQVRLEPAATGYSRTRQQVSTALVVLMCMVGLVLVIACFNVANLLIARAVSRRKEIAVRLAMGASRAQLLRQLLVESLLLSFAGGVVGIGLAVLTLRGLLSFLPDDGVSRTLTATPDGRILAFNFALATLTGVFFGLAPALQAMRIDLWSTLKDVAGALAGTGASVRFRKALVMGQVALSFLLLAGAGLFVKSLGNLKNMKTGFQDIDRLVTFQVDPALNGYTNVQVKDFHRNLLEKLRSTPGVTSAGYATVSLLSGGEWDSSMSVEGHQAKDGEDMQAFMNSVSPGYFSVMGVPLLVGRDFDDRDRGEKNSVIIVNRRFAEHFFGSIDKAIGRHTGFGTGPKSKLDMEIIGVVENTLYEGPREGVHRQAFVADQQSRFPSSAAFYVRSSVPPQAIFGTLRQTVKSVQASVPVYEMKTLDDQLDETLTTERLIATLSAAFGALATLLAAIGLYGVMAFVVANRTKEIGLRMALGAQQSAVAWMVMREVLVLVFVGLVVGVPAAYFLGRYVSSQLFNVPAADVWTAAIAVLILTGIASLAGFLPARRATTVDPIKTLRYE
ncbi:MAG TPA: ABC transporter permease [Bryobacteraceae bacterium]|nr:ABC transporter permease [Bryobacteraceae bacterium]